MFVYFSDYNNQTDLHIAVTTSSGTIVEFDRHGLRRHAPKDFNKSLWEQSLLVESVPEPWYDHWDDVLSKVKLKPRALILQKITKCQNNIVTYLRISGLLLYSF